MVFATREEEIDYLRDELERAGYDEASHQKWDEATLGRVRKLKLLEEEAPRRRRADVYDESGSDEEESDEEAEEVDEQGICWSGARGPDMEEEEAEAPARRRCAHVKEDGRQCPNFVIGNNEKCDDFDPTRFCGAACAAAAAARAEALAAKMEAEALERKRARSESDVGARKPAARRAAPGMSDMLAACARAPEPEPEAPPSPIAKKKKKKKKPKKAPDEVMTIVVRDCRKESSEEDTTVKLRTSTKLARVFGAYADGLGASVDSLRFLYKGGDVYGDETAGAIGLMEGACLDCVEGDPPKKPKKRVTGTVVRWDGSRGGIEPSEQGSGGRIAVRVSGVRRGTTLQVGDKVEYAVGRKGDARFALDVMVYAPELRSFVSRRPAVFRRRYAVEATRLQESWRWVVSF